MLFGWLKAFALVSLFLVAWLGVGLAYRRGSQPGDEEPAECPGCGCARLARTAAAGDGWRPGRRQQTGCPAPIATGCPGPDTTDNLNPTLPSPTAAESE